MMAIAGVHSQQGTDLSPLINRYAEVNSCDAVGLLAGLISESNLHEQAERIGSWPDWSEGLGQQTLAYAQDGGRWVGDHSASAANLRVCRDYFWQPENAIRCAAQQYGYYYRLYGDYHEAWSRYNGGPRLAYADNPNARNIHRGWVEAQAYASGEEPVPMPDDWAPIDIRDRFPFVNGEYPNRPGPIEFAVYHHGDSRLPDGQDDERALLDEYQALHTGPSRGWPAIAYSLAIGREGRAYLLNGLELTTYHAGDWDANQAGCGIVLLGDFTHEVPPADMIDTAIRARLWVAQQRGLDDLPYHGHQEYFTTACPGEWWTAHRGLLASLDAPSVVPPDGSLTPGGLAELASFYGWATINLADQLQGEADGLGAHAQQLRKVSKAKGVLAVATDLDTQRDAGLVPIISTLRRGGV
jgi:hypothetical protein